MEEDWDSQAEEAEEDSLEDSLEEDSLEEENEEAEEVEEVTAGKQLSPAAETSNSAIISAPSRGTRRRPSSRWDETGRFPNPTTASKTGKKDRQGYKSWRGHKNAIISCLHECGNISFTRRYLLFHHGVNFPRNVLHYYRHLHSPYYSQQIPAVSTEKDSGGDLQQKTSSGS